MNRQEKKQIYQEHQQQNPDLEPLEIATVLVQKHNLEQDPRDFLWQVVGYDPTDDFKM